MIKKKKRVRRPVWVAVILDESGSMESARNSTISGFNEFLQDRQADAHDMEVLLWLTKFNSKKENVYDAEDAREVPKLTRETYKPIGGTALLDAVGSTIFAIESRAAAEEVKPKVIVMVMTDGEENASRYFRSEQVKQLIEDKQAEGNWTFMYMGANQNSWLNSKQMGIPMGNTINYTYADSTRALGGASKAIRSHSYSVSLNSVSAFAGRTDASDLADAEVDKDGNIATTTK